MRHAGQQSEGLGQETSFPLCHFLTLSLSPSRPSATRIKKRGTVARTVTSQMATIVTGKAGHRVRRSTPAQTVRREPEIVAGWEPEQREVGCALDLQGGTQEERLPCRAFGPTPAHWTSHGHAWAAASRGRELPCVRDDGRGCCGTLCPRLNSPEKKAGHKWPHVYPPSSASSFAPRDQFAGFLRTQSRFFFSKKCVWQQQLSVRPLGGWAGESLSTDAGLN